MAQIWTRFLAWLRGLLDRKGTDAPAVEAEGSTIEGMDVEIPPPPASLSAAPDADSESVIDPLELPDNPMDSLTLSQLISQSHHARGRSDWEKSHNAVGTSVGEVRHKLELLLHELEKNAGSHADKRFYQRLALVTRERDPKLPPYPKVATELARLVDDPKFKIKNLVKLIERDPALIRAVWLQASSVVHGQPPRNLAAAVARLGTDALWRIAMSTVLRAAAGKVEGFEEEVAYIQEHGFIASDVAVFITGDRRGPPFLAGLLNSVGKLVIYDAAKADRSGSKPNRDVVNRMINSYHASFGMLIGSAWRLDKGVIQAIGHHQGSSSSPSGIDKRLCRSVARACLLSESILQIVSDKPLIAIPALTEQCKDDDEMMSQLTAAGLAWTIFQLGQTPGRSKSKPSQPATDDDTRPEDTETTAMPRRQRSKSGARRRRRKRSSDGSSSRRSTEGRRRRERKRRSKNVDAPVQND